MRNFQLNGVEIILSKKIEWQNISIFFNKSDTKKISNEILDFKIHLTYFIYRKKKSNTKFVGDIF